MKPEDMTLRYFPDKVLFKDGREVVDFDNVLRCNVQRMFEIMQLHNGIGLAAHQVGWPVRLFVTGIPNIRDENAKNFEEVEEKLDAKVEIEKKVFINPEFIAKSKMVSDFEEGCLSFPNIRAMIKRPDTVSIRAFDEYGKEFFQDADGLLSRCIQHEYDHITGQLFHRLWSPATLIRLNSRLKELQSQYK